MSRPVATWIVLSVLAVLCAAVSVNAGAVVYTYDNAGRLVSADYGNGQKIEYQYDAAGNLTEEKSTNSATPQNSISPDQGTLGTTFTIVGSGFGSKKGMVLVGKGPATIQTWTDEAIVALLKTPLRPQRYDVTIKPKEPKKAAPIVLKEAFRAMAPEIDSISPGAGLARAEVTVQGSQFGIRKGKLFLQYTQAQKTRKVSCKVLAWGMNPANGQSMLVFVVPSGVPKGTTCNLTITNQVGSATKAASFTIQ